MVCRDVYRSFFINSISEFNMEGIRNKKKKSCINFNIIIMYNHSYDV